MSPLFLIVVLDGMRRDMITPETTPNLASFRDGGCDFTNSRSVFPTETRVNSASLGSGCLPARHGIIANKFFDAALYPDRLFQTANFVDVMRAREVGGRMTGAPSLGEALAAAGKTMAVVGSGSAGTTRLVHPAAGDLGQVSICLRDWQASTPKAMADEILAAVAPLPPASHPNSARTRLQTRIFIDHVFPRVRPDVSVLWYTDPDSTFHYKGIGSVEARQGLADLDREFGVLLDWVRDAGLAERMQIFVLSDHGQIVARERLPVADALAGEFAIDETFARGADYVLASGYSGAVWVRDGDARLTARMTDALRARPWIGTLFADGPAGCFPRALLGTAGHARCPDIYFTLAAEDGRDALGVAGTCFYDEALSDGGGVHGGLHVHELNNLMMAGGSLFRGRYVSPWPCGIIDVAPTILDLLDLFGGEGMDGRPLREAYGRGEPADPVETVETREAGGKIHTVTTWQVGAASYIAGHKVG